MKKRLRLDRRSFLTGLGGTAIALPVLECMLDSHGEAFAQDDGPTPTRYIICFGGHSMGADRDSVHDLFVPDNVGPDYDLKLALEPLSERGVQDHVSVVSGLEIDWARRNGGMSPAGGRHDDFHLASLSPLLSGVRSVSGGRAVRGITSDQVVADAIAGDTIQPSLVYRVQASWYLDVSAPYGRDLISYRAEREPIEATVSPRQAFDSLFQGFVPPDPMDRERAAFMLRARKSVLDLVSASYERVLPRLSAFDRARLDQHLTQIRALEQRVDSIPPVQEGVCRSPDDPMMDPAIGGEQPSAGGDGFDVNAGYSDEDLRADVFGELIHMAMACDISRVASLQYTMAQSHMNVFPLIGVPYDLHEVGHATGSTEAVSQGIRWHVDRWAGMVERFANTPEGAGTMLDNTVIIYLSEGGHGYDPLDDKGDSTHSTERMAMLVAGHAGGLTGGLHVATDAAHPAQVLTTCMRAAGADVDGFGEVTGTVPGLLG